MRIPALSIVSVQLLCTFSYVTCGSYLLPYVSVNNGCKRDYIMTEVGRVARDFLTCVLEGESSQLHAPAAFWNGNSPFYRRYM